MPTPSQRTRPARPEDVTAVLRLVHELAAYEREPDAVEASAEDFTVALFGPDPRAHCLVGEVEGEVVAMALWFLTFSTWTGRHGIWLEDLYVRPEHRGAGLGRALLAELAAECTRRGLSRLEWTVLDWNTPAHGFYASLGAAPMTDWTTWRLDGSQLQALGTAAAG